MLSGAWKPGRANFGTSLFLNQKAVDFIIDADIEGNIGQ